MTAVRLLAPLSLALLAACAQQPRHTVELEKQANCPMQLKIGQNLTLTLPSNPSTGYRWQVQNPAAGVLRSLGPEVYSHPENAGIVGSAGQSTWRFQAHQAGEDHLTLIYQQPWAPEVRPVQTFDCTLKVN